MIDVGQSRDVISPFLDYDPDVLVTDDRIEIHTSDRSLFKRCRRKWNWQSGLRENLVPLGHAVGALWFGSGWHFIMEDYHGLQKFPDIHHAIVAYKEAFRPSELPPDSFDLMNLMGGMADYYTTMWLKFHPEPYQTLVVDGVPQVEVDCDIDITDKVWLQGQKRYGTEWIASIWEHVVRGRKIIYRMTFDRVVTDEYGMIYILDYKTARQIDTNKLSNDPQVSAYHWGGVEFYGDRMGGVVWQQHFKDFPQMPDWLSSSNRFSMNKNQHTTYPLYRAALIDKYGTIPSEYYDFLAWLAQESTDAGDRYIRRDILRRNTQSGRAEEAKILDEVLDMLDPTLPLYPNPTRDCTWDCPFKDPCIAMDDGSDLNFLLKTAYEPWKGYKQDWKKRIEFPDGTRYG